MRLDKRICDLLGIDSKLRYRVKKYVYGLPDAGRQFYLGFTKVLAERGYTMSKCDPCLFYRIEGEEKTFICIHVDDCYIFSSEKKYIDRLKEKVEEVYPVTVEHNANAFLGIKFTELPDGSMKMTQDKLVSKILNKYSLPNKKLSARPYPYAPQKHTIKQTDLIEPPPTIPTADEPATNVKQEPSSPKTSSTKTKKTKPTVFRPMPEKTYRSLMGSLLFLTRSRPEFIPVCSFAGTKSKNPSYDDYEEMLHSVEFLRLTEDRGLILHTVDFKDFRLILYAEVDASYMFHADSKGHTGYCIGFGRVGFFWFKSQKQTMVCTSST